MSAHNNLNDPRVIKEQYRDSTNLDARIALHVRFSTAPRRWFEWYFDQLELPPDARVLEIGCGPVQIWNDNRARIPTGWELTLSDFSFGMLQSARTYAIPARFVLCDAQAIPFRDAHFDAVLANHMLYHVPDISRALGEMRRVLKPSGKLYAATNGLAHMRELKDLVEQIFNVQDSAPVQSFCLENGAEQLAQHFGIVHRFDFQDSLRVTEVEPLVAYIMSMRLYHLRGSKQVQGQLRQIIQEHMAREGAFFITKAAGLFIAQP